MTAKNEVVVRAEIVDRNPSHLQYELVVVSWWSPQLYMMTTYYMDDMGVVAPMRKVGQQNSVENASTYYSAGWLVGFESKCKPPRDIKSFKAIRILFCSATNKRDGQLELLSSVSILAATATAAEWLETIDIAGLIDHSKRRCISRENIVI